MGPHTYDVLAGALDRVHAKFAIREKVVLTVTDNGSNFVKAFNIFSDGHVIPNSETIKTQLVQEDCGDVAFVEVGPILNEVASFDHAYMLPAHQRCGAHTLNLVAVKDAEAACKDEKYKKISRSALGKCSGLWNKASTSTTASETVHDAVKFALLVPNITRWSSYYYAVDKVCDIVRKYSETTLNNVCTTLTVALFLPIDISFIMEYSKVMQTMAQALDILQSEEKCYMGILLPTIVSLKKQLLKTRENLKLASPLVDALLTGVEKRFSGYLGRNDLILSSLTHPQFRLRWVEDTDLKETTRQLLMRAMTDESERVSPVLQNDELMVVDSGSHDDSFFSFEENVSSGSTILAEMDMFLAETSRDIGCLIHYPTVKTLFLRYNTGMPSSAPVERLFSLGGQILTPRRNRLSDGHFEMQLLLRANKEI